MKFSEIVDHLGKRGFATRKAWGGESVIVYGKAKSLRFFYRNHEGECKSASDSYAIWLDDFVADDWIAIPLFWNSPKDDYLPFRSEGGSVSASDTKRCSESCPSCGGREEDTEGLPCCTCKGTGDCKGTIMNDKCNRCGRPASDCRKEE